MPIAIGLGSNLDEPARQLCIAIRKLEQHQDISVDAVSGFYRTAPWGFERQAPFVNAVMTVETRLKPIELLRVLQRIEHDMGRVRLAERWGPRRIDLDLLTYNDTDLDSADLVLPHPQMHLRAFVLAPLLDIDAEYAIPGQGSAKDLLRAVSDQSIEHLGSMQDFCDGM